MKVLLRSVFNVNNDPKDALLQNYNLLEGSGLEMEDPVDTEIWNFVRGFVQQHHHPPEYHTIRGHFDQLNQVNAIDRLEAIAIVRPKLAPGDFELYLNTKAADKKKHLVATFLQTAGEILSRGITQKNKTPHGVEERTLLGPHEAMQFLIDKAHDILTPITGSRLSGEVTADAEDFLAEYDRVKADPLAGIGQFCGIRQIDQALSGAKKYELWVHAGFTSHFKSGLMLNWAYNQAVYYHHSSLIFSLEMPYTQVRKLLYTLHTAHPKFKDVHPALEYSRIRDGVLTPTEEAFLRKVVEDFHSGGYGKIFIEVADPNKMDFTVADMKHKAETIYAKTPFRLLFVDHALLVSPRKWVPNTTDRINEVIRDCKKLAMSFNKGMGMAVVLLFQINREGFKQAEKIRQASAKGGAPNLHVYNLTALASANETERSADVVTASWKDPELSKNNQILYQCLKSRDNQMFEPFLARVDWKTRQLSTLVDPHLEDAQKMGEELDLDKEFI